MKYRNVKTGVVIEAPSVLGGPWERIDSDKAPAKEPSGIFIGKMSCISKDSSLELIWIWSRLKHSHIMISFNNPSINTF